MGNVRAAARLLCSDETPAVNCEATYQALLDKHPAAPADRRQVPARETISLTIGPSDLLTAIRSFPNGSSGGIDGLTPTHLKDLVGGCDEGSPLVTSLTDFVNILLGGDCPESIRPVLFGGKLLALNKKDGGVRPIAVGIVWRRLACKCANSFAIRACKDPHQVGVGVSGGAEGSVHAARRYIDSMPLGACFYKLDFSNAFNTLKTGCHA